MIDGKSSDPCDPRVVDYGESRPFPASRFFGNCCNRGDAGEIEQDENEERECRTWCEIAGGAQRIGKRRFIFITIQYAEGADDHLLCRRAGDQGNGSFLVQSERMHYRFAELP